MRRWLKDGVGDPIPHEICSDQNSWLGAVGRLICFYRSQLRYRCVAGVGCLRLREDDVV